MDGEPRFGIKSVANKVGLAEVPKDVTFWRTQPYEARLAALEEIRQEYNQWMYPKQEGIQKVVSIIHL